jgi:hypothetical protein
VSTVAVRSSALAVPTRQELEALGPGDRWTLEERLNQCQDVLRDFNDEELRRWVEVEGKTYTEIATLVGRSTSRISERCIRLGLSPKSNRGRPRISGTGNSGSADEEVVDAEVVEDDPQPLPASSRPASGPAYGEQPARGVRAADHQARLITSVAGRMEDIQTSIGEIDQPTAATALSEGDRLQCLQQLRNARMAVSQLIKALE